MNREEFGKIMEFVFACIDKDVKETTIEAYFSMLGDLPFDACMAGVKKLIGENIYPTLPTIGAIRQAVYSIISLSSMSSAEALRLVNNAIQKHGSYGKKEVMLELPEYIWGLVESMGGWLHLCQSTSPDVWQSNFLRHYDVLMKRQMEKAMLPQCVKDMVGSLANAKSLNGKKGELTDGH